MASKNVPVKIQIKAIDQATKDIRKFKRSFRSISVPIKRVNNQMRSLKRELKEIQQVGRRVGKGLKDVGGRSTKTLTTGVTLLGAGIFKASADFEKGMNRVKARLGDKFTQEGFQKLTDQAKQLGAETQFSATQAAGGMAFLAQAGWDTNQIIGSMPGLLNLAASAEMDLARAADITSNVMGAFGIEANEAGRVADVFAAATSSANIDMEQLGETMKAIAPIAAASGKSLEETTAVVGLLGNIGIQGSEAGTALKNALLNLASPATEASKIMKKLGIQVADSQGNMLSLDKVMGNVGGAMGRLNQKQQLMVLNEIFGKRAIAGASELAKQALIVGKDGSTAIGRFTKALENSQGRAEAMAKTLMEGGAGAMVELKSATEGLAIAIGDSGLLGDITAIIKEFTGFVRTLSQSDRETFKLATKVALLAAAFGPVLYVLGTTITVVSSLLPMMALLKSVFMSLFTIKKLTMVFKAFWVAMTGPIGLVIAGVGLLIGFGALLYKKWEPFRDLVDGIWSKMKSLGKGALKMVGLSDDESSSEGGDPSKPNLAPGQNILRQTVAIERSKRDVNVAVEGRGLLPNMLQVEGADKVSQDFFPRRGTSFAGGGYL